MQRKAAKRLRILAIGFFWMYVLETGITCAGQLFIFNDPLMVPENAPLIYKWVHACSIYGAVFVVPAAVLILLAVWSAPSQRLDDPSQSIVSVWCITSAVPFAGQWVALLVPMTAAAAYAVCCAAEIACLAWAWRITGRKLAGPMPLRFIIADYVILPAILACVLAMGIGTDVPPFGVLNALLTPAPLLVCACNLAGVSRILGKA